MKAWLPWDSPFAEPTDGRERDSRISDCRYNEHNTCEYPGCEAWIKNDAHTCKSHRDWYYAKVNEQDEQSRAARHAEFKARLEAGESITHVMYEARKGRL